MIDQTLSYSLEEEDRASEDGGPVPRRMRTQSELSSDDGRDGGEQQAHAAERGLQNLNSASSESALGDGKTSVRDYFTMGVVWLAVL